MKAELKPEELRINNVIGWRLGTGQLVIGGVHAIESDRIAISEKIQRTFEDGELGTGQGFMTLKGIEPIELSEEWLLKAGFEDITEGTDLNTHYSIRANRFTIHFEIASGVPHCFLESVVINCYHVHSLQNLFYQLTGNELIFNHG